MKKGIAIRTILLLVLGILVAGIVIFLVYKYASGSIISETECNARLTEICLTCKNAGWGGWPSRENDPAFFSIIDTCANYTKFSSFGGSNNCGDLQNPCKMFGVQ